MGGERRTSRLTRIYFSSSDRSEEAPAPALRPARELRVVALWNTAGGPGESFLDRVAEALAGRGVQLGQAWHDGLGYRLHVPGGTRVEPAELPGMLGEGKRLVLLRLGSGERGPSPDAVPHGAAVLILTDSRVPSLRAALQLLKSEGHPTAPVVAYRPLGDDLWEQLAPLRLAEAALRYAGRRISIWYADRPQGLAGRLAGAAAPVAARPGRPR